MKTMARTSSSLAVALATVLLVVGCDRSDGDFFRVEDAPQTAGSSAGADALPTVIAPVVVDGDAQTMGQAPHGALPSEKRQSGSGRDAGDRRPVGGGKHVPATARIASVAAPEEPDARAAPSLGPTNAHQAAGRQEPATAPPEDAQGAANVIAPGTGDARALNRRAIALINSGDAGSAIPLLERAVAAQPRDAEMLGNLGYAYMLEGRNAQARTRLAAALELAPTRSATWLNLGQTYAELGRRESAVDAVVRGYQYSTRKASVRAALQRAAREPQFSPAWREAAGLALDRIGADGVS